MVIKPPRSQTAGRLLSIICIKNRLRVIKWLKITQWLGLGPVCSAAVKSQTTRRVEDRAPAVWGVK